MDNPRYVWPVTHVSCPPAVLQLSSSCPLAVRPGGKFNLNSGNKIVSLTAAEIDLDEIFVYKYFMNIFRKNQY